MKIVITSQGEDLEAAVDPKFGRCQNFLFIDTETLDIEHHTNEYRDASGGAGIQAAQFVAGKGAEALITGHLGPNALQTLASTGIRFYPVSDGTVRTAVERFKNGELEESPIAGGTADPGKGRGGGGGGSGGGGGHGRKGAANQG